MKNNYPDHLNNLLKGEIAAVETYGQALDAMKDASIGVVLRECQADHAFRANKLSAMVLKSGGEPAAGSGAWGQFAKMVEAGAVILGEEAAIGSLEEGEDQGLSTYRSELPHLDGEFRTVIEQELLPGQQRTYNIVASLKKNFSKVAH